MSAATTANSPHTKSTSSRPQTFSGFPVPPLLSWQNPSKTGFLLIQALGLFAILSSPLTLRLFLRFAASVVGAASVIEWGSRAISGQSKGLVSSYQPSRFFPFNEKFVHNISAHVAHFVSQVSFGIQRLIDARDPAKGLKLALVLYTSYLLLGVLSLKTLVLSAIVLAFSLPPLYLQFKRDVDHAINDLQIQFYEQRGQVWQKVNQKAGPQIDFLKKLAAKAPADAADAKDVGASEQHGSADLASPPISSSTGPVKVVPTNVEDIRAFDSVPTLAGNISINHEKLAADLAADRAKAEGAVNGL